jgi:hypothetical protein
VVDDRMLSDFETMIRKTAIDLTNGVFVERMPPMALWERAEKQVNIILEMALTLKEEAVSLKPEKYRTIEKHYNIMVQKINTFREILFQRTTEPLTNSRLAIEQLRQTVVEASDFLHIVKEAKMHPNPVIKAILDLEAISQSKMVDQGLSESESPRELDASREENSDQQKLIGLNVVEKLDDKKSEERQTTLDTELKKIRENGSNK